MLPDEESTLIESIRSRRSLQISCFCSLQGPLSIAESVIGMAIEAICIEAIPEQAYTIEVKRSERTKESDISRDRLIGTKLNLRGGVVKVDPLGIANKHPTPQLAFVTTEGSRES